MASDRDTLTNLLLDCEETAASPRETADYLIERGVRPPARVIETAEAIADEPTGTVIRSWHGDIGSVDHGPHGEWSGVDTVVHFLDFVPAPCRSTVGELAESDMTSACPWTVLWQPEVNERG